MAHLLVTSETLVVAQTEQENENRSIGKHKRGGHGDVGGLACFEANEGSAWLGSDTTKRRALVSITNQPNRILTNSTKPFSNAVQRKHAAFPMKSIPSLVRLLLILIFTL